MIDYGRDRKVMRDVREVDVRKRTEREAYGARGMEVWSREANGTE